MPSLKNDFAVALVLALACMSVVAVAAGQEQPDAGDGGNLTIEDLRQGGDSLGEKAPTSVRMYTSTSSISIRYYPVEPLAQKSWYYLGEEPVLRADDLEIRTIRYGEIDREELTVRVAYWQPEVREVRLENETVIQRQVANISRTETKTIRVGQGYDSANITLRNNFHHAEKVTMCLQRPGAPNCLQEPGGGARWVFDHQSAPQDQSIPFNTAGGLWGWLGINLLIPTVGLTGAAGVLVPMSIRKTGAGPRMGLLFWSIALIIGALVIASGFYFVFSSLLISTPYVAAFLIAGITAIIFLEKYESGVRDVILFRMHTEDSEGPSGDLAKTANAGEFKKKKMVNMPGGEGIAVLPKGIRPWIARLFGGATLVHGLQNAASELDLWNSEGDKLLFVASDAEHLIEEDPERLRFRPQFFNPPRWEDLDEDQERSVDFASILGMLVWTVGGGAVAFAITGLASVAVVAGGLTLLVTETHAVDGVAGIKLAPNHAKKAYATAMYLQHELDQYRTFEEALQAILREKKKSEHFQEYLEGLDTENVITAAHEGDTDEFDPFARDFTDKDGSSPGSNGSSTAGADD